MTMHSASHDDPVHLFEEPGTLDQVIDHAARWFVAHFDQVI
jgi:hypothetical protein